MLRRYKESLHADPQDAVANLNLGLVAKRKQNLPLASASLRRAAELLPENDDVKLELFERGVEVLLADDEAAQPVVAVVDEMRLGASNDLALAAAQELEHHRVGALGEQPDGPRLGLLHRPPTHI